MAKIKCILCDNETKKTIKTIDGLVCEECYTIAYKLCSHCEEIFHEDDFVETVDGKICRGCADELYHKCDECEELFHENQIYHVWRGTYCEKHRQNNLTKEEIESIKGDIEYHSRF